MEKRMKDINRSVRILAGARKTCTVHKKATLVSAHFSADRGDFNDTWRRGSRNGTGETCEVAPSNANGNDFFLLYPLPSIASKHDIPPFHKLAAVFIIAGFTFFGTTDKEGWRPPRHDWIYSSMFYEGRFWINVAIRHDLWLPGCQSLCTEKNRLKTSTIHINSNFVGWDCIRSTRFLSMFIYTCIGVGRCWKQRGAQEVVCITCS